MFTDIEQTRRYYSEIKTEDLCNCDYCKNYYSQIKEAYPFVADYLNTLGIDIEKPFETSPLEIDEYGFIEYCVCQYIVFGKVPDKFENKIGDVKLGIAKSYPKTNIQKEHFVLDICSIKLKWTV